METVATSAMVSSTAAAAPASAEPITPALAKIIEDNHYILRIVDNGPFGYTPDLHWPMVFCALYGISAMVHVGEVAATKHWWLLILVFGCVAEAAGNGIRIYGHYEQRDIDPYIAQQVILVVTPVFFAAVHYAILGRIIELFGPRFTLSHIKPKSIIPLFLAADLISLVVQGTGSGLAAVAETDSKDTTLAANIVVVGLCVQLAAYACFQILILNFFWKTMRDPTTSQNPLWTAHFKWFLLGFFLSSLLVLGRSAFRAVEMITGWIGPISTVEWYYYAFDATPVCVAVILLNIFHPGFVLPCNHRAAVQEEHNRRQEAGDASGAPKRKRPRSSWFAGDGADHGMEGASEMDDVAVISSSGRQRTGTGATKPHIRTASLASTLRGDIMPQKSMHSSPSDDSLYKASFGWSQPQSPEAVAYGQYRERSHPIATDWYGEQSYSPAMMSSEGFETVHGAASHRDHLARPGPSNANGPSVDSASPHTRVAMRDEDLRHSPTSRPAYPPFAGIGTIGGTGRHRIPEIQVWRDEATPSPAVASSNLDRDALAYHREVGFDQRSSPQAQSSAASASATTGRPRPQSPGDKASMMSVAKSDEDFAYAM